MTFLKLKIDDIKSFFESLEENDTCKFLNAV